MSELDLKTRMILRAEAICELESYNGLVSAVVGQDKEIKRLKNENNRLCKEISGSESQRARECRKLVLAEVALSEIRALPDEWDDIVFHPEVCSDQLRAILEKYDA